MTATQGLRGRCPSHPHSPGSADDGAPRWELRPRGASQNRRSGFGSLWVRRWVLPVMTERAFSEPLPICLG